MSILLFIAILFFLVTIHELGHFLFAKYFKMRVDEFAFGFPPRLFSRKYGGTEYSINLIPLGGYVKIFGENGLSEDEKNALSDADKKQMFGSKKVLPRILVLSAGVLFNLLGACLLFALAFMYGTKLPLDESELVSFVGAKELIVVGINDKSPLLGSGLTVESKLLSVEANGSVISEEINGNNFNRISVREFIQNNNNAEIKITYEKNGLVDSLLVIPKAGIVPDKKVIGAEFVDMGFRKYDFLEAFSQAIKFTFLQTIGVVYGLYDLVRNLIWHDAKISENLAGPVGLATMTGKVSEKGLDQIYIFAAMLSISLAVFNFLPIPALDGGRIVFVLLEAFTKKKIRAEVEQIMHAFGFLLLLGLMLFVTYFDIVKAFAG